MRHITHFERLNGAIKRRAVIDKGLDLIKRFKGFSRIVYFCPAGYPTIGYGHVVKDDENFSAGINEAQAEELLLQDAVIAERAVLRLINVPLTDDQFDALISFTYMRRKINREQHGKVLEQCMCWVWVGGRRLKGLVQRRAAEADFYQTSSA